MTTPEDESTPLLPDEPPKNGIWEDNCDLLAAPTDEEMAEGEADGQTVNYEEDDDE